MALRLAAIVAFALLLQDEKRIQELVDRLRSDDVSQRDEAAKELKALGKKAVPALETAAKSSDAEVSSVAKKLIVSIELAATLTPALRKWKPGIEDLLAAGGDAEATKLLLEAVEQDEEENPVNPGLWPEDLEALATPALRGAETAAERAVILRFVSAWRLRSASTEVVRLLDDREDGVRIAAAEASGKLGARDAVPKLRKMLAGQVAVHAVRALVRIGSREAARDLLALLESGSMPGLQYELVSALIALDARELAPDLVRMMSSKDDRTREAAVRALGTLGGRDCVAGLVTALADCPLVANAAMGSLISLRAVEGIPDLVKMLGSRNANQRALATNVLMTLHEAIPPLIASLKSDSAELRGTAAGILSVLGAPESAADALMQDPDAGVRVQAARAAGRLRLNAAAPRLVKMLADENEAVVIAAAGALGEMGAKESIPELAALLKKSDLQLRSSVVDSLGLLGAVDTAGAIADCAGDEDESVRESVAGALGRLGGKAAPATLAKLLDDKESYVRLRAAQALGRLGDPAAAEALLARMDDEETEVARDAIRALTAIGAKKSAGAIAAKFKGDDSDVRKAAIYAVAALGDGEAVAELVKMLRDEDDPYDVPRCAGESLAKLRSKAGAKRVLTLLRNGDPSIRANAVHAAGEMNLTEAGTVLMRLLEDPEADVRGNAAEALGRIDAVEAAPALVGRLLDENPAVRWSAARALARVGAKQAEAIAGVLSSERTECRAEAATALAMLGAKEWAGEIARMKVPASGRAAVADALCLLGSREGIATLLSESVRSGWIARGRPKSINASSAARIVRPV